MSNQHVGRAHETVVIQPIRVVNKSAFERDSGLQNREYLVVGPTAKRHHQPMGTGEVCKRLRGGVLGGGVTEPSRSCEKRGANTRTASCCALVYPHRGGWTTRARARAGAGAGAHRKPDSARTLYRTNTSCKQATPSEPSMTKDDDERKCIGRDMIGRSGGIALLEERERGPEPCGKLSWEPWELVHSEGGGTKTAPGSHRLVHWNRPLRAREYAPGRRSLP